MLCWSCQKEMPDAAEFCPHCEAKVIDEPTEEEQATVLEVLADMPSDVVDQLRETFVKSISAEDFVNQIMVGDCPKCGSESTGDCEADPDIEHIGIGRCFECGQLWCPFCAELFTTAQAAASHDCPALDEEDLDDWDEEDWDDEEE